MRKVLFVKRNNSLALVIVLSMILFTSCGQESAENNQQKEKDYKWNIMQLDMQNDCPAIDAKTIEYSLQDEEYKDKIFG